MADRLQLISTQLGKLPGQRERFRGYVYDAACCFALCSQQASDSAAQPNSTTTADEAKKAADQYREQALAALEKAVAMGYDDLEHLKTDSDLTSLHQEPRFKELLNRLSPPKAK